MGLFRLALLGGGVALLIHVLHKLDVNKQVYTHHPGHCEPVPGISDGAEDVILLDNGWAVISSGIHVFGQPTAFAKGRLYAYDMRPDAPQPRKVTELKLIDHPVRDKFHPAGIASYAHGGKTLLYVVRVGFSLVDVFEINVENGSAKYLRSLADPQFGGINNLVMTGLDQFYVTNFIKSTHWLLMNLEMAVPWGTGSLLYFDGKSARVAVGGMKGPNGVDLSKDGKHLYVASTQDEALYVYKRNKDNTVTLLEESNLGTGPDNVNVDRATGDIYIGSHPIMYKMLMHILDRNHLSPSQVIKVTVDHGSKPIVQKITEVFADDGRTLSGSTAAVKLGDRILIGSLADKALDCYVAFDQ